MPWSFFIEMPKKILQISQQKRKISQN